MHAGIHPLRRHAEGYPIQFALKILKTSNGLTMMVRMTLELLTSNGAVMHDVSRVQRAF